MGKNNRTRRAAKAKARAKARAQSRHANQGSAGHDEAPGGGSFDSPGPGTVYDEHDVAGGLWLLAAELRRDGDPTEDDVRRRLASLRSEIRLAEVEHLLLAQVDAVWEGGWQPAELARQGDIGCRTASARRLVRLAIATDHAGRRATTLDHRWRAQVDGLGLPTVDGRPGWVARWAEQDAMSKAQAIDTIVAVLANLLSLPTLHPLLPLPGRQGGPPRIPDALARSGRSGGESDPVLLRIRNLLAKAESSTFEAEATTLTAKAQELMTRHAIDAAMVDTHSGREAPIEVRIPIDAPYADAKSLLLQKVTEAGRCRSVFHPTTLMSTVVGFKDDVAAVEMLFTSLLVQAQHWLSDAARSAPPGTRTRGQSYRSAFLVAFSDRIGQRLQEINDQVLAAAGDHDSATFLPVLRSRSEAIDDYVDERFGELESGPVRSGFDGSGWASGRLAADNAQLSLADLEAAHG